MSGRAPVCALALVLLAASPASAHTGLSGSVPADGATTVAPDRVVLSFSGRVLERLSAVTVVGPDGTDAADGALTVDGTDVVQPLDGPLQAGRWTVSYRVVAADGHPLSGRLDFTVAGAMAPPTTGTPAATGPAAPAPTPATAAPAPSGADAEGPPPVLLGGLLAGGLGLAGLVVLARRRGSSRG